MSAVALTQAVDAMAETAEDTSSQIARRPAPARMPVWKNRCRAASRCSMYLDAADLLPYEKVGKLELGPKLFPKAGLRRLFALVDDYTEYGNGSIYEVTYQLYHAVSSVWAAGGTASSCS